MASIIDAVEECYQEEFSFMKFVFYAVPLYFCIDMIMKGKFEAYLVGVVLTSILLFGFMLQVTSNVRNSRDWVLPSFNFIKVMWTGLKGFVALGPLMIVAYALEFFIYSLLVKYIPESGLLKCLIVVTSLVCASIPYTGYVLYAIRFKIADAYNLKLISTYCIDVLFPVVFLIPQMLLVNIIIILPVSYVLWVFLGIPHPIITAYWCIAYVFNIAITGHYLAQVGYEAIASKENDDFI